MGTLSKREVLIIIGIIMGVVFTAVTIVLLLCEMRRNQQRRLQIIHLAQPTPPMFRRVDIIRLPETKL